MTTLCKEKIRCCVCGLETEYTMIGSTNAIGSADLDTRPPEMERSTTFAWVQRCPECGYCASDVSMLLPGAKDLVSEEEYKKRLSDPACSELTNSFLCKATIEQKAKDYAGAFWSLVHAAWVCDDNQRPSQAVSCRQKAAEMLLTAEEAGQPVANQNGLSIAILVDLLRRSGRFEQAREVIAARRPTITEGTIARVLDFQSVLIEKHDISCHRIVEAFPEPKERGEQSPRRRGIYGFVAGLLSRFK